MNTKKDLQKINDLDEMIDRIEPRHKIKAHKIGDLSLTITTIILVIVSLYFGTSFAPFIILLMSSRIGTSVYTIIKATSKKEIGKLIVWIVLLTKSVFSYGQLLIGM